MSKPKNVTNAVEKKYDSIIIEKAKYEYFETSGDGKMTVYFKSGIIYEFLNVKQPRNVHVKEAGLKNGFLPHLYTFVPTLVVAPALVHLTPFLTVTAIAGALIIDAPNTAPANIAINFFFISTFPLNVPTAYPSDSNLNLLIS